MCTARIAPCISETECVSENRMKIGLSTVEITVSFQLLTRALSRTYYSALVIPRRNKMFDKYERIPGGNEMVISTVLKPVFVLHFGHSILSRQYSHKMLNSAQFFFCQTWKYSLHKWIKLTVKLNWSVCEISYYEKTSFKLVTTRIKTNSSKTGGEVGFSKS